MDNMERKISDYIDSLNQEKKPKEHKIGFGSSEFDELAKTVRIVRNLKEYEEPELNFEQKIIRNLYSKTKQKERRSIMKKFSIYTAVAAVMAIVLISTPILRPNVNIVQAMEASYEALKAYHGTLEIVVVNEDGEESLQAKREVWADEDGNYVVNELEGVYKGLSTKNNGEKKWQVEANTKEVEVYSAFPDTSRFTFELGNEVDNVSNAIEVKEIGEETISGRKTTKLEVTPKGGNPYHLWVDKETNLPIQRQSVMQNALQYIVTYTEIETVDVIPTELITFEIPEGFVEIDKSSEQLVESIEDAKLIAGIDVKMVENLPQGYELDSMTVDKDNSVRTYYNVADKKVVLLQRKAGVFDRVSHGILGTVNNNEAEYISSIEESSLNLSIATTYGDTTNLGMVRWQENGFEYAIVGDTSFEQLTEFAGVVSGGDVVFDMKNTYKPEVKVDVDLELEESTQKSVDAGSFPWKLDPAYVAQVEASLLKSPEGITGDYPVEYDDIEIIFNNGVEVVANVKSDNVPVERVFLEKLVRQDNTGIWTMVGYDPAK